MEDDILTETDSMEEAKAELERRFNDPNFLQSSGFGRVEVRFPTQEDNEADWFTPEEWQDTTFDDYTDVNEEDYNEWNNQYEEIIDNHENRAALEREYGEQLPDTEWETQSRFAPDDGGLANKTIDEAANIKEASPNEISAMKEIYDGFKYGCYETLRSLQEIGAWGGWKVAELVAGEDIEFDPMKDTEGVGLNQGESPEPQTTAGSIVKAGTQGAVGLALGGGITKAAGAAVKGIPMIGKALSVLGKNAWGKRLITTVVDSAKGFVADTISFNTNEGNFMEMLKAFDLPSVESIAKGEEDEFWTRKVKNGVDGILAGVIIGFIGGTAKLMWKTLPFEAKMAGTAAVGTSYGIEKIEEAQEEGQK